MTLFHEKSEEGQNPPVKAQGPAKAETDAESGWKRGSFSLCG
jgi:hypothetical protein